MFKSPPCTGLRDQVWTGGAAGAPAAPSLGACHGLSPPSADAGAPVYFYEFQHRPHCLQDRKPAFVRADHTDEIRFVFGGAFLKGDVVMFGEELAQGHLLSQAPWGELGGHVTPPHLHRAPRWAQTMQELEG